MSMLSAAEDAWRELSSGAELADNFSAAPLTFILERFLTISLDPSRQGLIEGPGPPSILNQFRRMREIIGLPASCRPKSLQNSLPIEISKNAILVLPEMYPAHKELFSSIRF